MLEKVFNAIISSYIQESLRKKILRSAALSLRKYLEQTSKVVKIGSGDSELFIKFSIDRQLEVMEKLQCFSTAAPTGNRPRRAMLSPRRKAEPKEPEAKFMLLKMHMTRARCVAREVNSYIKSFVCNNYYCIS